MTDLFSTAPAAPLAELLRPSSLDEFVGQAHLVGEGAPLRLAFESGTLHSFILWGPPGVGKTTLARLGARLSGCEFVALSAVNAGVKDIREAAEQAQRVLDYRHRPTVLFIDEIHRLNAGQQDALLPHVESGLFTLVGATTSNPSFSVNAALLSRTQVYVLQPLTATDLKALYVRARASLEGVSFTPDAVNLLVSLADSDARRFLNLLQVLRDAARSAKLSQVNLEFAARNSGARARRFDNLDWHYDGLSALQKSIRGSAPDAALYWLARLVDAGADMRNVCRRLVVMAAEDIGNADPQALVLMTSAVAAYERAGPPEGELALAQAVSYLACAPKSNASYLAWNAAKAFVANDGTRDVPLHLRNAPTELMKKLGFGHGYRYPHDEPEGYAAGQTYLPEGMREPGWYRPTDRGYDARIRELLEHRRGLDAQARKPAAGGPTSQRSKTPFASNRKDLNTG